MMLSATHSNSMGLIIVFSLGTNIMSIIGFFKRGIDTHNTRDLRQKKITLFTQQFDCMLDHDP